MWHRLPEHQQRGAQFDRRGRGAPADAVAGREAQDHEQAGGGPRSGPGPGGYPADPIEQRGGGPSTGLRTGITPSAPDPPVEWDERVQPERAGKQQGD